jgi:hypothetical protein
MFTRLLIIHMCDVIPKDPDAFPTCTQILLPLCFSLVLGIIDRDVPIIGGPGHGDCGAVWSMWVEEMMMHRGG